MKQIIESSVARVGAAVQNLGASLDYDVLALPGGSLIAILLWIYASAARVGQHPSNPVVAARRCPGRCATAGNGSNGYSAEAD